MDQLISFNDKTRIMFTVEQIKSAHAKVRSGADFPKYVQDLVGLGVIYYETYVTDGHTDYHGKDGYRVTSPKMFEALLIQAQSDPSQFKADLLAHQQGKTDYLTFCADCAKSGVEKWKVNMAMMTCTYHDKQGNEIVAENIPSA
jgi:uncharacterized protein YbcV (DUF1398 family)